MNTMSRKELEQAVANKLNEIATLFDNWHGYDAKRLNIAIGENSVSGFIYEEGKENPIDFSLPRLKRNPNRMFTPELGDMIGKVAKECLFDNDQNPLCWASDEGVELMRQKLVFRLQEHDLLEDLKSDGMTVSIERV